MAPITPPAFPEGVDADHAVEVPRCVLDGDPGRGVEELQQPPLAGGLVPPGHETTSIVPDGPG